MTKQDLIAKIAELASVTKKDALACLEAFTGIVISSLKDGEKVTITGFGCFEVSERSARPGVNPRTKEPIKIPAMKLPIFRAGKTLKDSVRS